MIHNYTMGKEESRKSQEQQLLKALHGPQPNLEVIKNRVWMEKGLLSFIVRRQAWFYLIGEDPKDISSCPEYMEPYRDDHQIDVDVQRSLVHFDVCRSYTPETLEHNRRILKRIIRAVLIEEPTFHYYQGFHDIVEFLLVYSQFRIDWTYTLVKRLMHSYLRDFMQPNLSEVEKLLKLVFPILQRHSPELVPILKNPEDTPVVLLPWVLTLFTHSLSSLFAVARLFDVLLLHPLMSLYLSAAIVHHFRDQLLADPDDRSALYRVLGRIDAQRLPIEKLVRDTQFYYRTMPPSNVILEGRREGVRLAKESMVSEATAREPARWLNIIKNPGESPLPPAKSLYTLAAVGVVVAAMIGMLSNQ